MIELIKTTRELDLIRAQLTEPTIGFVPTLGNLHNGHLELIKFALDKHPLVFVSIFVNPKQFGKGEDLEAYPRTLTQDLEKISSLATPTVLTQNKKIIVYAPQSVEEVFPADFDTSIQVGKLAEPLCGASRKGHFEGVTTVVYRLFSLVRPSHAYFGHKDYQQYLIIKKMCLDLKLPIEIIGRPIVRDQDGLALSSRNSYLNQSQRQGALLLPKTIDKIGRMIRDGQVHEAINIANEISSDNQWDYLKILDSESLTPLNAKSKKAIIAGALHCGAARLIDNSVVPLNP